MKVRIKLKKGRQQWLDKYYGGHKYYRGHKGNLRTLTRIKAINRYFKID